MNTSLLVISSITDALYYNNFFEAYGAKRSRFKFLIYIALIAYVFLNVIVKTYIDNIGQFTAINICALLALSFLYKIKIQQKIIITLFSIMLTVVIEIIVAVTISALYGTSITELQNNIVLALIGVMIAKSIALTVSYLYKNYYKRKTTKIPFVRVIPYMIVPLISFAVIGEISKLILVANNAGASLKLLEICILVFCSNILFFLAFDYVLKIIEQKNTAEFEKIRMESDRVRYEDIMENQKQLAKRIHDIKNKIHGLKSFVLDRNDEATKYLDEIWEDVKKGDSYTGILGIDSIINLKVNVATQENILFNIKTQVYKTVNIDVIDLCMVVGNLLDNAFDAMEYTSEKEIDFEFIIINDFVCISIRNKYGDKLRCNYAKREREKILHGHGVISVKEIVKKYHGIIDMVQQKETFAVYVLIENK